MDEGLSGTTAAGVLSLERLLCAEARALENSDYSVGFEAVELSNQSEGCGLEELKGHNQLWDALTF